MLNISGIVTVKVEGLIRPPLAQMASTKACYKLGLTSKSGLAEVCKAVFGLLSITQSVHFGS